MKQKINWVYYVSMAILFAAFFMGLVILAFLFFPFKVTDVRTPYKILTPTVKQGDSLVYVVDYCKYLDLTATVTRALIDGSVVLLPEENIHLPVGCHQFNIKIPISKNVAPGKYKLIGNLTFELNVFRKINTAFETENFTVLAADEKE